MSPKFSEANSLKRYWLDQNVYFPITNVYTKIEEN